MTWFRAKGLRFFAKGKAWTVVRLPFCPRCSMRCSLLTSAPTPTRGPRGGASVGRCDAVRSPIRLPPTRGDLLIGAREPSLAPRKTPSNSKLGSLKPQAQMGSLSTAEPGKAKLGFVGIGIMGLAMARRLLDAGYEVTVWNRSADKLQPLTEAGAKAAATPKEVVQRSDITFAMLADPAAAVAVALGTGGGVEGEGVAQGISGGKGYVDVSTIDAASAQQIAQAVRSAGGQYLEAPVSGSKQPAESGTLIFLCSGDKELFDAAHPCLDVMGKASFFLGQVGSGSNMKLVVNMIMGSMMAAFAEGLTLAERSGLSQQDVVDVVNLAAIASPMYKLKGPAMVRGEYPTAFPLKHQQKDMRLALELGAKHGLDLEVAAAAHETYQTAAELGAADKDFSAVLEAVKAAEQ